MGSLKRTTAPGEQTLRIAINGFNNAAVKVGFFETAKYADGTPVAYVFTIQEFGHAPGGIPPRPTMRPTVENQRGSWATQFGSAARAVARGAMTPAAALDILGAVAAGDLRASIAAMQSPPLAEATVKARQRRMADRATTGNLTKPLVDTGVMVNAVTHVVEGAE